MGHVRKKRNYFPEPKFQLRFLAMLVGGILVQAAVVGSLVFYFVRENYTILVQYGGLDAEITNALQRELFILIAGIVSSLLIFVVGTALLGIIFSHRIAGPIYAIKRTIRDILAGRDVELRFRNRDEFGELVEGFNEMVRKLRRGDIPMTKQPKSA